MLSVLRNRVRIVGSRCRPNMSASSGAFLAAAIPGNIGHLWVKRSFISGVEPLAIRLMPNSEGGMLRQYITARLEGNPSMAADDPGDEARLEGLGSKSLRRHALGRIGCRRGRVFRLWSNRSMLIAPFSVPHDRSAFALAIGAPLLHLNRLVGRRRRRLLPTTMFRSGWCRV